MIRGGDQGGRRGRGGRGEDDVSQHVSPVHPRPPLASLSAFPIVPLSFSAYLFFAHRCWNGEKRELEPESTQWLGLTDVSEPSSATSWKSTRSLQTHVTLAFVGAENIPHPPALSGVPCVVPRSARFPPGGSNAASFADRCLILRFFGGGRDLEEVRFGTLGERER